ncbi:YfhD family protein [Peribacillus kribbensis]|uniref:YfhD family protein n=1 Tax=Peribacillus kribbensis TaxID=356658 RepID=UPI000409426E|nr:YfhD family protein [Peribacillus kribbensis]
MARSRGRNHSRNKQDLPLTPKELKHDGIDVEFSEALADTDDMEAQARSKAADQRAKARRLRKG